MKNDLIYFLKDLVVLQLVTFGGKEFHKLTARFLRFLDDLLVRKGKGCIKSCCLVLYECILSFLVNNVQKKLGRLTQLIQR